VTRNPWDWYVSWYFFRRRDYEDKTGPFSPQNRPKWGASLDKWEHWLAQPDAGTPVAFRRVLPEILSGTPGSYSQTHEAFFPAERDTNIVRFESMREDLLGFFREHKIPTKRGLLTALKRSDKKNVSKHGPYEAYYDGAARDLVAEADRAIIERYGYEF
jgi:hypothetical protein